MDDPVQNYHMTKKFGKHTAVDSVKCSIRNGEVFCLLGHNGAGKTTLINLLTGMLQANSGDAIIGGQSLTNNLTGARSSMGLCQQFDVHYEQLTVVQHIELVQRVKMVPAERR